jgi:hypothetical protein
MTTNSTPNQTRWVGRPDAIQFLSEPTYWWIYDLESETRPGWYEDIPSTDTSCMLDQLIACELGLAPWPVGVGE